MLILRPYQTAAVASVYRHWRNRNDNPCVVIPTGGGKTLVMATICRDTVANSGRVLVLAHRRELLEQSADTLQQNCPELTLGIYSAGLQRRDTEASVICAGIQSVYQRHGELGSIDQILIDEAHLIPRDGDGMYQRFLAEAKGANPNVRMVGFTATPYRLESGLICEPTHFLNHVCFQLGVRELIDQEYLSPLVSKNSDTGIDTSALHVRRGEFVAGETEALMDKNGLVEAACQEIVDFTHDRRTVLIFATGIEHGRHVQQVLRVDHGINCGFITGDTPAGERDATLSAFRDGTLRYLCNVNVLTTGFDAPRIDCVVILRPTMSPGLYYQMAGRGLRLFPGKTNCLVLDFGGNVRRHGPVDAIRFQECSAGSGAAPTKKCLECHEVIAAGFLTCPQCGFEFPAPKRRRHAAEATQESILSGQQVTETYQVLDVAYSVYQPHDTLGRALNTMRIDYHLGLHHWHSELVCFSHEGYARQKAEGWWQRRSPIPVPDTTEWAVQLARAGALCTTRFITIRTVAGETFGRIVRYDLAPRRDLIVLDNQFADREVQF